ncbi:hypothetical protein SDAV_001017 [Spiroplasma phoeniceum P40]|uniref:Uncharacterized protein n=1 Tax=Spiroplasma phoeniceum P40 TaxID=1276259 RepID=A0A345DP59_9MOLU|nr:hypothetical protein SDAV_001017 [Spiroplasma phoeniceum P40]
MKKIYNHYPIFKIIPTILFIFFGIGFASKEFFGLNLIILIFESLNLNINNLIIQFIIKLIEMISIPIILITSCIIFCYLIHKTIELFLTK